MCIYIIANRVNKNYPLLIAGNRDEFYNRESLSADYWEDNPEIFGGKDLKEGGGWFLVNCKGRFAFITNYRDPLNFRKDASSRGLLVKDFINSHLNPQDFITSILPNAHKYNGFNIIIGNNECIWYYSNVTKVNYELTKGYYVLSNALLNSPWHKSKEVLKNCKELIESKAFIPELLFQPLENNTQAPVNELPETGVGLEMETLLSSVFISSKHYGTRSSTVYSVDNNNIALFLEKDVISRKTIKVYL